MARTPDIFFKGTDFILSPCELDGDLLTALTDCGGSGDAAPAVEYVMRNWHIDGNVEDCKSYLKGYGAWTADDLSDHKANLERLVWLLGCDLDEQGEGHFSTY